MCVAPGVLEPVLALVPSFLAILKLVLSGGVAENGRTVLQDHGDPTELGLDVDSVLGTEVASQEAIGSSATFRGGKYTGSDASSVVVLDGVPMVVWYSSRKR